MKDLSDCNVLIVDDTEANVDILVDILEDDYVVSVAMDGESALEYVAETQPDLILLDIMMPEMDGYEVCQRIKADPQIADIPIIFLTAKAEVEDETKGLALGAVDYITKPISPPIVQERIKTHLALRQAYKNLDAAKQQVESTHRQIMKSISYAQRIQRSILPSSKALDEFLGDYFVVWKPRDVVGGDLYWCKPWGDGVLVILADCTGHGVPGAFMTLIANGALENALNEVEPGDPGALIGNMHQRIQYQLNQTGNGGYANDGLELGICFILRDRRELIFSGAKFSLFQVGSEDLVNEIKGDKSGIGYPNLAWEVQFKNVGISIAEGNRFFLTTDGLIDQIGGQKRRSFGKTRLKTLLADLNDLPLKDCGDRIYQAMEAYQGEEARRDDIAFIGFQL